MDNYVSIVFIGSVHLFIVNVSAPVGQRQRAVADRFHRQLGEHPVDENQEWCANVPSLPGCHSQGEIREETIDNIKDAIETYIDALEADDHRQLHAGTLRGIVADAGLTVDEFIALL